MDDNLIVESSTKIFSGKTSEENLNLINLFLENIDKETYDGPDIVKIITIFDEIWLDLKYGIKEAILFLKIVEILLKCEVESLKKHATNLGITYTAKDLKKGKEGIIHRLLGKYHRKKVTNYFSNCLVLSHAESIEVFKNEPDGSINALVSEIKLETLAWIILYQSQREDLLYLLKESYPKDYAIYLWKCLMCYITMDFEIIMDKPHELSFKKNQIQQENKKLHKNLKVARNRTSILQRTIYEKEMNEKALLTQMHGLYNDAVKETEDLKRQLQQLKHDHNMELTCIREMFEEERAYYQGTINALRLKSIDGDVIQEKTDLTGQTVAVIGGNRERHYREIVKRYNGEINFVPEDKPNLVQGAVLKSNVVFFLSGIAGHVHWRDALNAAKIRNIPFIYVNTKGVTTFEGLLLQYIKQSHETGYRIQLS
ncbi:DUF2325 domain-containing protein [Paenibacillus peoriae]|uniref:DUF2325 domain-containing protein n=1 Tax=Paenibacillus peoriae TaxID=59893 RepID=A0A7H0Y1Z0_9BACL|nr:DUF2325 domain-containing protein [Paenibacillus peoriae]QNR65098.1 DUF2325 domain-containing protein [Paenibacillus peoriae]